MRMAKRLGWNRRGEGLGKGRGRRGEMRFESLEERQLLASDVATLFLPQSVAELAPKAAGNPFTPGTVSLEESAALAVQRSFVPGQLIVARYADASGTTGPGNQAETSWSRLTGIDSTIEIAKLLSHPSTTGRNIEITQLDLGARTDVVAVMRQMANSPDVLWSSPNYTYEGADPRELTPNDTQYGSQYHHPLMKNNLAWDTTLGSPSVIIGVTDDGVARSHVDLNANIWVNPGEIAGDGIDNDANGRIDDVNGWDFISNDNNPNPNGSDSHGTHVAGIAAGRTNNGIGIAGTAGGSTIMPIKFYDSANGGAWTSTVIFNSMKYGVDNGAKIISTSYNIDGFAADPTVRSALQYIHDNGRLHFNSAGNNSALNPPRQVFEQTLLVASTTENDTKSSFSNYGTGVDISSPGSNILSTVPTNAYALNSGTSMATPNAAGVAALIWSAYPNYTRDQVAATLLATADNIDAVNGAFAGLLGSGRVNSFRGVTETVAAPKVKSLIGLPAVSAPFSANINAFSVSFNQVMGGTSVLDNANYELRSAGADLAFGTGDDQVIGVTRTNTNYMVGTNLLNFTINGGALSSGNYRLTILSGGVVNAFGTALDGDGNGVAGADFTHEFSIDLPVFVRTGVPGGLVSASQGNLGTLASAVEVDTVPFFVDAGSKVSAVVRPTNLGATLSARIPGVTGVFTAPSPGAPVAVPAALIGAAGILGLEITGNAATGYTFDIFKNADVTGIVDDSSVVSLEGSSLPLGSQRFAAIGDSSGSPGGYAFTKYNNPGLFVDISSTGTGLGLGDDDEATVVTTVGNALFPAGSVTIGNNGGIIAGGGQDLGFTNGAIPNSAFGNALLPFWDDIHSPAGNVYWQQQLVGGVNTLIVQWHNRPHYNNVGSGTFQLQLFASGPIAARYVYTDVDYGNASFNGGASATIGYQTSASVGSQYSQNAPVISNGDVIDISFGVPTVDVDEYSIDLTPYVGRSLDVALEGTGGLGFAGDLLEIIDPSNAVVATGTITPAGISVSNYDQGIAGFVVGTGGVHKIRVSSGHGGRYALLVTEDLVLDTEPNQSAPYRTLDNTGGALGYLAENDIYRLTLAAGQEVTLETSTPFDDPASRPLNNLDPALTVLDGASTPLASDSNSLDGKNARLNFVAPSAGEYLIRVSVESGVGEYVLHVDAATGIDGDFNDDGRFDCDDINALSTAIASGGSIATYDLNGDAALTLADQDAWRLEAGSINIGAGRPYLPGDANLDAVVDGSDFGIWNSNKFTANTNWCSGNFNADSVVDGSDFGIWNSNKFTASDAGNRLPAGLVPQAAPAAVAVEAVFADHVIPAQGAFTPSRQPLEAARTVTAIPEVNRSAISGSAVENRQARRVSRDRVFEIFGQV